MATRESIMKMLGLNKSKPNTQNRREALQGIIDQLTRMTSDRKEKAFFVGIDVNKLSDTQVDSALKTAKAAYQKYVSQ